MKTNTPPATVPATPAESFSLRSNPEIDAKIDAHIKERPDLWAYLQSIPIERLQRMVVWNEIQRLDRAQRVRDDFMTQMNRSPELKQAYDTIVKNVPEELRENVMMQIDRATRRTIARSQRI